MDGMPKSFSYEESYYENNLVTKIIWFTYQYKDLILWIVIVLCFYVFNNKHKNI